MINLFINNFLIVIVFVLSPILSIKSPDRNIIGPNDLTEYKTYLPSMLLNYPVPPPIFGTQVAPPGRINQVFGLLDESGVSWVRLTAFKWSDIEPIRTNPPTYDWTKVKARELENLSSHGMHVIAIVSQTPDWAQKKPPYECGPISEDAFDEYIQFLQALVKRYGIAPYNIKYWEMGNEPDIDPNLIVSPDSVFGCWGDETDEFYGGGYYAEMLKVAYPAIKAVDPIAQVLIGGLLLDCDPTHPPPGKTCQPATFLEGILRNGGGNYFDIVNFHGYPPYNSDQSLGGRLYYDEHHPGWEARGGMVLGKINFLREIMAKYGINKPIMHTEGSLNCPFCSSPTPEFLEAQADYAVWLYVRNWAEGLKATVWYQFNGPGWRFTGMLDENQNPKPVYHVVAFLIQELAGATYKAPVMQYPPLKGYEFRNPKNKIWILWSPDGESHPIDLPVGYQKVLDKYGIDITPSTGSMSVDSPIYIELIP